MISLSTLTQAPAPEHCSPHLLMRRLGDEIARLMRIADGLETLCLAANDEASDPDTSERLQRYDLLQQSLGELSQFMHRVAEPLAGDGERDFASAFDALRLSDMRDRLEGKHHDEAASGDFESF